MNILKHFFALLTLLLCTTAAAVDGSRLLPAERAFIPHVRVGDDGIHVRFELADGYYLYRSKIEAATQPDGLLGEPSFSAGKEKSDEFFGLQEVYYQQALIQWPHREATQNPKYSFTLNYQGCADVGICYPPTQTTFEIDGQGEYSPSAANPFLQPDNSLPRTPATPLGSSRFKLSWDTLNANLLAFFIAGLGLSLTACMYPLLPIVSSIIVGDQSGSKRRAFTLSMVYVQGLALTYTMVGVIAGLSGALLTVWLQQPWVVLSAAAIMIILALAMFDVYTLQLPAKLQSFFHQQSNKLSGGKIASVFAMGMFSALIVGPCVAPPLAFALGYIGQTGDATLGGIALYALALGTGIPLIIAGTFGGHILPRAGAWMNGIKYTFGVILLAVAVYMATPFLPYTVVVASYSLLMIIPAGLLLIRSRLLQGKLKWVGSTLGVLLLISGTYFATQSSRMHSTDLHRALSITLPGQAHFGRTFFHPDDLNNAIQTAFSHNSTQPILVDFYADWCVSCKEMAAYTFSDTHVQTILDEQRFFQIDVTANTPAQQALLKEYGLFGPPGLFVVHADGSRSEALLGFAAPAAFLEWYQQQSTQAR